MFTIRDFELKNTLQDLTVREYERIATILRDESRESIERYCDVLEALGMPTDLLDTLTDDELFACINSFSQECETKQLVRQIEIAGYTLTAYGEGEEFVIRARDLVLIEKAIKNETNFLSRILAIIFKRDDLTRAEHYSNAHITHKAEEIGKMPADLLFPYLVHVTHKLSEQLKTYTNGQSA
jgi:hypothetical protein